MGVRKYRLGLGLRDALVVIVPIVAAIALAYQLSLHDQRTRAQIMADLVLSRSERTTIQLAEAFKRLEVFKAASACSTEAVALMRQIDLASSLLQGVGFVQDNQLLCSSLGEANAVEVGAPDYVTATGATIRRQRALPISAGTPLLLITGTSGYTGLVHPALIFSLSDDGQDLPAGTVTYSTRETIIYSSATTFNWARAEMPADAYSGTLVMEDQLLAWSRSRQWDQFAYAAVPLAAIGQEFQGLIGFFFAGGARKLGELFFKAGDRTLIDGLVVNGSAKAVGALSGVMRHLQTGYIYHYAFVMVAGLLVFLTFLAWPLLR